MGSALATHCPPVKVVVSLLIQVMMKAVGGEVLDSCSPVCL